MKIIDILQRKINSILFRFLIIAYSTLILMTHENIFHTYIYLAGFLLYFIDYIILLKHEKLRLLNDFFFFSLIIIGKNPNEAFIFIYILLPTVNSINFSGVKKSPLLYILTALIFLSLECFYLKRVELQMVYNSVLPFSSLLFLWTIDLYTTLRIKIRDFRERLNEVVDSFYTDKELIRRPHKIYSELIALINNRIKKDLIVDLFCFTVLSEPINKIIIVNGSKFVFRYKINEPDLLKKLKETQFQININFVIDNQIYPHNLALLVEIENIKYIFIFTTKKAIPLYYVLIGFFRTLVPTLYKMAKILLSEKRLQEIKNEELKKLAIRSLYVTRATKTMHYIRNRLGPINNLIKMLYNKDEVDTGKIYAFEKLLVSERDRAKIELENIISMANYLLEKSNNPFNFANTEAVSLKKLYTILSRHVNLFFPEVEILIVMPENTEEFYVEINDEGFELVLSDWLSNIKKYYDSHVYINFNVTNENVNIDFFNDYKDNVSINQLISDIKSNDRNEIMRRTTHGLYQIKTSLEEMNINYNIEKIVLDKNLIKFTVNLKTKK